VSGTAQTPEPPPAPARDLLERLLQTIDAEGPISVARYMSEALLDPRAGFYATKDPIGAGSDFITAPEVSQMFGELIGLWCVQSWIEMGAPERVDLVELGPGRGTMIADALRAAQLRPDFIAAARITLVEASPALKAVQAETLANAPCPVMWMNQLPAGDAPCIVLGNEFLDCLPIRQFVRHESAWRERLVGRDPTAPAQLAFLLAPSTLSERDCDLIPAALRDAPEGALVEASPGAAPLLESLAARFASAPGRALFIDYGPAASETGDTLQAIKAHEKVDPLAEPGQADLTARVDFAALSEAAHALDLSADGSAPQGDWLKALGLEHRAAALIGARPDQKGVIARQVHRLTDEAEMGALFKAICVSSSGLPPAAGF
jgi:NADH dehydrogenase [ubiquinone] 1 alpha subcomplex assembly factor 7